MYSCWLYFLPVINGLNLNVYQSTLNLLESQKSLSGLYFQNTDTTTLQFNSLSVCIRFNFKKLGKGNDARIFAFDWPESPKDFVYMYARYPATWMTFGLYPTAYGAYIIGEGDNYNIWATQRWHHICLSFDKKSSKISLVKVSLVFFPKKF